MEKPTSKLFELSELCRSFSSVENFEENLLRQVAELLDIELSVVVIFDKDEDNLFYEAAYWRENQNYKKLSGELPRIKIGSEVIGICAQKKIVQNISTYDFNSLKEFENNFDIKVRNLIAAPMVSQGELIGVLIAVNKRSNISFSKDDEMFLLIVSNFTAMNLEVASLRQEISVKNRISNLGQSILNSAHGLKNILNNMDGGAYIVEKGAASKNMKDVEKGWDIIKRNTHRLRDLVLDILLFSRPKQPEFKLSSINKICEDIEELISQNAKENNVEIKLFLDRTIPDFKFDPTGMHRCLLNLVTNAIYACTQKGGGRVNIITRIKEPTTIEITISDNGIGISEYNLPHIFDVFFTTKGSSGTGLGLPVAKKIIDDHQGSISVTSAVNIGTRFVITLPNRVTE